MQRRLATVAWAAVLTLPPVGAVIALKSWILAHPLWAVAALVAYWVGAALIALIGKVLAGLQKRWVERLIERSDSALRRRVTRYRTRYRYVISKVHHDVDLRGLTTRGDRAVSLEQVFIDLRLVPQPPQNTVAAPVAGTAVSPASERIWDLLRTGDGRPIAIIGPPGGGKTTLLKHVAISLAHGKGVPRELRHRVPILLFLREHVAAIVAAKETTVAQLVSGKLKALLRDEPPGWFESQLSRRRCVVMLDGLDEVAEQSDRRTIVEWVESQIVRYPGNIFVITSRPFGYVSHPLNSATVVQVQGFTDREMRRFLHAWYRATMVRSKDRLDISVKNESRAAADDLVRRLRAAPELFSLTASPLLLTMIAHVHHYRGALPGGRLELYREICQVLLGKRQEAKGLLSRVTTDQKEYVIRQLAYAMMMDGLRDIPVVRAGELIRAPLSSVDPTLDPRAFLDDIEVGSGILVQREAGVYAFAHLTFQEYLAATWIRDEGLVGTLVRHVRDDWWNETALLYAAQADAAPIVAGCLAASDNINALALAADCVEEARNLAPELRARVEAALSTEIGADATRRRLVAGALMARKLRHTIATSEGARVCAQPVTNLEYGFFAEEMAAGHDYRWWDAWVVDVAAEAASDPAYLFRARDVRDFVSWARGCGVNVRLPRRAEIADGSLSLIVDDADPAIWILDDRDEPTVFPGPAPTALPDGLAGVIAGDIDQLFGSYLELLEPLDRNTLSVSAKTSWGVGKLTVQIAVESSAEHVRLDIHRVGMPGRLRLELPPFTSPGFHAMFDQYDRDYEALSLFADLDGVPAAAAELVSALQATDLLGDRELTEFCTTCLDLLLTRRAGRFTGGSDASDALSLTRLALVGAARRMLRGNRVYRLAITVLESLAAFRGGETALVLVRE